MRASATAARGFRSNPMLSMRCVSGEGLLRWSWEWFRGALLGCHVVVGRDHKLCLVSCAGFMQASARVARPQRLPNTPRSQSTGRTDKTYRRKVVQQQSRSNTARLETCAAASEFSQQNPAGCQPRARVCRVLRNDQESERTESGSDRLRYPLQGPGECVRA